MIAHLAGKVLYKNPDSTVIDVNGVGYHVMVSVNTFCALPDHGSEISLFIHTHVREDALLLFGFSGTKELEVFKRLIGVTKIGPKLAMTILSGAPPERFVDAVINGDKTALSAIPGVGKKTAERIIMELADKFAGFGSGIGGEPVTPVNRVAEDTVSALVSLGYKRAVAEKAANKAIGALPSADIETALKNSLAILSSGV